MFILRRRLLALVDLTFTAVQVGKPQTVLRLSPELSAELLSFVCVGHLAVIDLRVAVLPKVFATDASSSWQAGTKARLPKAVATELLRHTLQKGTWTRLLTPSAAYLREHDMLEPERELPGECFNTHPIAEVLAMVPSYTCTWRKEYKVRVHINVAEMEA